MEAIHIQSNYRYTIIDKPKINKLVDNELVKQVAYLDVLTFSESEMTPRHDFQNNFEVLIPS